MKQKCGAVDKVEQKLDNDFLLNLLKKYKNEILMNYNNGLSKKSLQNYDKGSIRTGSEAATLYCLIRHFKYKNLIDVGTGPGFSSVWFAQALKDENLDGIVHTIDTNPETETRVLPLLKQFNLQDYVRFHIGSSTDIIPKLEGSFDFCLVDGMHSYEQTKIDFENVYEKLLSNSLVAFHDAYTRPADSPGVRNVIEEIVAKKPGQITFFNEKLFDYYSFPEDVEDARRIAAKWKEYNYSYVDKDTANPKELMCVFLKE